MYISRCVSTRWSRWYRYFCSSSVSSIFIGKKKSLVLKSSILNSPQLVASGRYLPMYRSPVKEWQVSWFVLGKMTLNGTDTVVCKYCRTVPTKRLHISIKLFYCSVCVVQSYCSQNKAADLPLFYWRPVHAYCVSIVIPLGTCFKINIFKIHTH